jgi:hypothetical protein
MFKKTTFSISMLVLGAALLLTRLASADTIILNLTNPVQTGAAGSTLSFDATVAASGKNGGTVYLNGDNFTSLASPLISNDDGFLFGFPLSLDPGDSFSGLLFTIMLPSDISAGQYLGSFTILGGANGEALDELATVDFTVNATAGPSAVPEPESLMLLATGLAGMMLRAKRWVVVRE